MHSTGEILIIIKAFFIVLGVVVSYFLNVALVNNGKINVLHYFSQRKVKCTMYVNLGFCLMDIKFQIDYLASKNFMYSSTGE